MKKRLLIVILFLFLASTTLVYADDVVIGGEGYNWEDPTIVIGGSTVNVMVESWPPDGETVSRKTRVLVVVPRNVDARITDRCGMVVRLVKRGWYDGAKKVEFQVHVFKPLTDQGSSYAVTSHVFTENKHFKRDGEAGTTIVVRAWVPAP